jgi:protein involved in polysaccharide export with SLBB domain
MKNRFMKIAKLLTFLLIVATVPLAARQAAIRAAADYVIGPLDEVSVSVNSPIAQTEFGAKNYRVASDGTIVLPHLDKPVKIGGLTQSKAREVIRQALIDAKQYSDPQVDVNVTDYRNSSVTVQGAVRNPGSVTLRADRMNISDAISTAGGLQPSAGSRIWVHGGPNRPKPDPSTPIDDKGDEVFRRDEVVQGRVLDPTVYDGDTILVEVAPHFYVTGFVKSSQSDYSWEPNITLQKALAMAGGPTSEGALNRVEIRRKDPKTGKLIKAKMAKGDMMLTIIEPDDVIIVPKRRM